MFEEFINQIYGHQIVTFERCFKFNGLTSQNNKNKAVGHDIEQQVNFTDECDPLRLFESARVCKL